MARQSHLSQKVAPTNIQRQADLEQGYWEADLIHQPSLESDDTIVGCPLAVAVEVDNFVATVVAGTKADVVVDTS